MAADERAESGNAPAETAAGDVAVSDHLRSTDPEDDAVYRVVGTGAERVTLLHVSDGDGRRAHTGEVFTVPTDALDSFEQTENPDGNRPLRARLSGVADGAYRSLRSALTTLAANPGKTLAALALFVVGRFGTGVVPLPDGILAVFALVGVLGPAAVSSGRI